MHGALARVIDASFEPSNVIGVNREALMQHTGAGRVLDDMPTVAEAIGAAVETGRAVGLVKRQHIRSGAVWWTLNHVQWLADPFEARRGFVALPRVTEEPAQGASYWFLDASEARFAEPRIGPGTGPPGASTEAGTEAKRNGTAKRDGP